MQARTPSTLVFWAVAAASALALAACAGTSTGNPQTDTPNENDPTGGFGANCDLDETALEADEVSPLGFSGADILAFAEGTHTSQVTWTTEGITHAGSGQTTDLTVVIAAKDGGEVRFVEATEKPPEEGDTGNLLAEIDQGDVCPDFLAIDVTVTLTTADGLFDETFDAELIALTKYGASIRGDLDPASLGGSFELSSEGTLTHLWVNMNVSSWAFGGTFGAGVDLGEVAMGGQMGQWGDANPCDYEGVPVPHDEAVEGFSATDVVEALTNATPGALSWSDAGETSPLSHTITLDADARVCAVTHAISGEPAGTLIFDVHLGLISEDGRLEGSFVVEVIASPEGGALGGIRFVRQAYLADGVSAADFEAVFGISGVDLSGYDGGTVQLGGEVTDGALHGELKVLGLTQPDCSAPSESESGDEGSSGGCAGTDFQELLSATF